MLLSISKTILYTMQDVKIAIPLYFLAKFDTWVNLYWGSVNSSLHMQGLRNMGSMCN